MTWKDTRGELLLEDTEYPSGPDSYKSCLVPSQLVSSPESCTCFMSGIVFYMLNLDDVSLCHDIASKIGSFVSDFPKKEAGRLGFYASAHAMIVEDFVREVNPLDETGFDEEDHVVVSRGASKLALKKLKEERFYMKEIDASESKKNNTSKD